MSAGQDVVELIGSLFSQRVRPRGPSSQSFTENLHLAYDRQTGQVIARGEREDVDAVAELIAPLDQPRRICDR